MKLNLTREKKYLMLTILAIALIQMPQLSLTPAIDTIATVAFPDRSLADVQEAFSLVNVFIPLAGVISTLLINRGLLTKRASILAGLVLLALSGLSVVFLNTEFWHIRLLSIFVGTGVGLFIVNSASVFFDSFTDKEREPIAGFQTTCINGGGILLSLVGGALAGVVWYGGYFVLALGLPIALLAYFTIPRVPRRTSKSLRGDKKSGKLKPMIIYYAVIMCLFMLLYSVCGSNISTHLAQAGENRTSLAGVAVSIQMAGGAICGLFFGKLSEKLGDMILVLSSAALVLGYALLGLFPGSVVIAVVAVFIAGAGLSCTAPRVMFTVSSLANESTSATASAIINSVAPSLGGFLSPYIITRTTLAMFGESTAARYMFTGAIAAVMGIVILCLTISRRRRGLTDLGEPKTV